MVYSFYKNRLTLQINKKALFLLWDEILKKPK